MYHVQIVFKIVSKCEMIFYLYTKNLKKKLILTFITQCYQKVSLEFQTIINSLC